MKIYKYTVDKTKIGVIQLVKIPRHGELIKIEYFNNEICMWHIVTECDHLISVPFIVTFTGDVLPDGSTYLGTAIDHERKIVYHLSAM